MSSILKLLIKKNIFKKSTLLSSNISFSIGFRNETSFLNGYSKTSIQKLSSDEDVPLQITSYNEFGFLINQNIHVIGPMIIFPKSIFSWNISDINEINDKSLLLFKLLVPKIDILIIGTGDESIKIKDTLHKWLIQNKLKNYELLPTEKAVNVFNFLIAENRYVAGAFLPSRIFQHSDIKVKQLAEISSLYRENK